MCELKPYYSAQELIGLQLVILPTTKKAVIDKAKRENWQSRKRVGRGGGVEYALSSLPQEVQEEIRDKFATSVVAGKPKKLPVLKSVVLEDITEKQRQAADARMTLVAYILQLEQAQPRYKAVKFFCQQAKQNLLSPELMALVAKANNKKGESRVIGERTLNQWVLDYEKASPRRTFKSSCPYATGGKKGRRHFVVA